MRCCCPPDSSVGVAFGEAGHVYQFEQFVDSLAPGDATRRVPVAKSVADVFPDVHVGKERVVLEDDADVAVLRRPVGHVLAVDSDGPLRGDSNPAMVRSVVVLPQPDGPTSVKNSPWSTVIETSFSALTSPKSTLTRRVRRQTRSRLPPTADAVDYDETPRGHGEQYRPHRRCSAEARSE